MASDLPTTLIDLQDQLRLVMITWRDHRTGLKPILPEHQKAFEDQLVELNFGFAEVHLDVLELVRLSGQIADGAQARIDACSALMAEAASLLSSVIADDPPPPEPSSNVVAFTGVRHERTIEQPGGAA